jgi:dynein heavy chain 1
VQYYGSAAHTIAFLKRESYTALELSGGEQAGEQLCKQLQLLNLGYIGEDFNLFELAATYVEYSLLPLFNSYKASKAGQSDKSSSTSAGFEGIQKNLAQLKVHLVHCQRNVAVPEIELIHDAEIRAKGDECKAAGRELTPDDFEGRLQDRTFVERLEKTVRGWIRDIRRVTQLTHEPGQGPALQEINFWLSMERSLAPIDAQLKQSKLLAVTLELLRRAQKHQLAQQFGLDTELGPRLATARGYNRLLRDFPINQLLGATTPEQAREAIGAIFAALRAVGRPGGAGEGYPAPRAVRLLEALTRDLTDQLLKILAERAIMHLDY